MRGGAEAPKVAAVEGAEPAKVRSGSAVAHRRHAAYAAGMQDAAPATHARGSAAAASHKHARGEVRCRGAAMCAYSARRSRALRPWRFAAACAPAGRHACCTEEGGSVASLQIACNGNPPRTQPFAAGIPIPLTEWVRDVACIVGPARVFTMHAPKVACGRSELSAEAGGTQCAGVLRGPRPRGDVMMRTSNIRVVSAIIAGSLLIRVREGGASRFCSQWSRGRGTYRASQFRVRAAMRSSAWRAPANRSTEEGGCVAIRRQAERRLLSFRFEQLR